MILINKSKNIVVIGGNAAGPAAAAKAKRVSPESEVILLEAGEFISTGTCELPYLLENTIKDYRSIIFFDEKTFFEEKKVLVKNFSTVKSINRKQKQLFVYDNKKNENYILNYDKLVLATGSYIPNIPEIIESPFNFSKFKTINDFFKISDYIKDKEKNKVLILGAGFTGLELSDALSNIGKSVILFDKRKLFYEYSDESYEYIKKNIQNKGIELLDEQEKIEFIYKNNNITHYKLNGRVFEVDYVVQCTGVRPNNYLGESSALVLGSYGGLKVDNKLKTSDSNIFAAGDNIEVQEFITGKYIYMPIATLARKFGHIAGENAAGGNNFIHSVIKNITFKFGKNTFAFVGLSLNAIKQHNYRFMKIYAASNSLVHVMPNSEKVYGRIYVDVNSNLILGAEFWGDNIAANYADIISLYIKNRIKANNLEDEMFNYSPPVSPMINLLNILGQKLKKER